MNRPMTTRDGILDWVHNEATDTPRIDDPGDGDLAYALYICTAEELARAMRIAHAFDEWCDEHHHDIRALNIPARILADAAAGE